MLPKLFALIQSKGPDTGGIDKETICFTTSVTQVSDHDPGLHVVFELHVRHHGCPSVHPCACAAATGSVLIGDWWSFLYWTAGSERVGRRSRSRPRQRVQTHAYAQQKPDRCSSIDGPASPEYFKDDEQVTGSNGSGPCLLRLRSAWRSDVHIPLLLWAFMHPPRVNFFFGLLPQS